MPPRIDYSNGDMLRMQRDAEMRVQQMRNRARSVAMMESDDSALNRNWSSATGRSRQLPSQPLRSGPGGRQFPRGAPHAADAPPAAPEPAAPPEVPQAQDSQSPQSPQSRRNAHSRQNRREQPPSPPPPNDGTIIGDVMGALGMEDDTLLIIGLLLILINQKADTTLLLALAYLLI